MAPPSGSDEFALPERTVGARVAELIERTCLAGVRVSRPITVTIGSVFLASTLGGFTQIPLSVWAPSHPFSSIADDGYFAPLGVLSGGVVRVGTGSTFDLAFLENGAGPVHDELSILASCIGFSFGPG